MSVKYNIRLASSVAEYPYILLINATVEFALLIFFMHVWLPVEVTSYCYAKVVESIHLL